MCCSCDAYSSVQGGEIRESVWGQSRVGGVRALQVASFGRVLEGQCLESEARL